MQLWHIYTVTKRTLDCYLYVANQNFLLVSYNGKDHRWVSGIQKYSLWAFGILPVGMVMCVWASWTRWGRIFRPLCSCMMARKASMMRSSANIMPGLWIQRWWHTILRKWSRSIHIMYKNLVAVVSLSVRRGNFVWAKVSLGLISVRYVELRGIRFLEVRNVLPL